MLIYAVLEDPTVPQPVCVQVNDLLGTIVKGLGERPRVNLCIKTTFYC